MSRRRNVCLALFGLLLTACGGSDVDERISSAEGAYASEDAASSRRICDEIMDDNAGDEELTAMQWGRLSILYVQLYDRTDDSEALDMATKCYRSAYESDADSAAYFYSHLPVEQEKYGMSLSVLVQSIDSPADVSDVYGTTSDDDVEAADSLAGNDGLND